MVPPVYVISTMRRSGTDKVIFEVVTDRQQRLFVAMRSRQTSAENIAATIEHAIEGLYAKPSPVR